MYNGSFYDAIPASASRVRKTIKI